MYLIHSCIAMPVRQAGTAGFKESSVGSSATTDQPGDTVTGAAEVGRRGRTRERLLDAAYAVFAEHGVRAATLEQISERAGFTRGAFYSNFRTKEELFFALMERQHALRLAALEEKVEVVGPSLDAMSTPIGEEQLGEFVLAFLLDTLDDRTWCLVHTEFLMLALRDPEVARDYVAYQERFEASLVPVVRRALERAGRELVLEPLKAVRMLGTMHVDAMQSSILAGADPADVSRQRTAMVQTVLVLTRPVAH